MKTKEKDEKEVNLSRSEFMRAVVILTPIVFSVALTILFVYISVTSTQTIAVLKHQLYQANSTLAQQKAQISNLTGILNLNESQVIFNKAISIGSSNLMSTCNTYGCSSYPSAANTTLHFNFTHAGYIVINTTGQSYVFLLLMQNYSRTWSGVNDSGAAGTFNFSVRSLTMPVLPGPASLKLFYYNATVPYEAQLTIIYHS